MILSRFVAMTRVLRGLVVVGLVAIVALPSSSRAETAPAENAAKQDAIEFFLAESQPADGLTKADVPGSQDPIYLHKESVLGPGDIESVRATKDAAKRPEIDVAFSEAGKQKMAKVTSENMGKRLAIVVGGKVIAAPHIISKIEGRARITGSFSQVEVDKLAKTLQPRTEKTP